jgi:hypothetical protein
LQYSGGNVNSGFTFTVTTAVTCFSQTTNAGALIPVTTQQSNFSNGTIPRWSINGTAGTTYSFSTCTNNPGRDTKIRIYDPSGTEITSFDNNGLYCSGTLASGSYTPTTTGQFFVSLSNADCGRLTSSTEFTYWISNLPTLPTITSFTPSTGPVGTQITLIGTNLNRVLTVSINGINQSFVYLNSTSILITVASGTTTGPIQLTYSGGNVTSSSVFTVTTGGVVFCAGPATNRGQITPITILNTVTGIAGEISYWSFSATAGRTYRFSTCGALNDTKLRVYDILNQVVASNDDNGPVCNGAAASLDFTPTINGNYNIVLTNFDCQVLSNNTNLTYELLPGVFISSFSPTSGPVGTQVTVIGSGFTNLLGVSFSNGTVSATTVNAIDDTSFVVAVPINATTGKICILAANNQTYCSGTDFVVTTLPTFCAAVNPSGTLNFNSNWQQEFIPPGLSAMFQFNGQAGQTYAINTCNSTGGNDTKFRIYDLLGNLVGTADDNGPYCNSRLASIDFAPATTGTYYLVVSDYDCNPISQTVTLDYQLKSLTPSIISFTPTSGAINTIVTITGTELLNTTQVSINGVVCNNLVVQNNTTVSFTVAPGTTTGLISLTTPNGTAISATPFTVIVPVCNLNAFVNVRGGATVSINFTNGVAPYSVNIDGSVFTSNANSISVSVATARKYDVTITDANLCTKSLSFRWGATLACNTRFNNQFADSIVFYPVPSGEVAFMYDGAIQPNSSILYSSTTPIAATSILGTNPSNLSGNGTGLVLRLNSANGQNWEGYLACGISLLPKTYMGGGNSTNCSSNLLFRSYPSRQQASVTPITQLLTPSGTSNTIKLDFVAFRLEAGQSLEIYFNATGTGVPAQVLTGTYNNYSIISSAPSGQVFLKLVSTNQNEFPGIFAKISCVPNVPSIRFSNAASPTVCTGASLKLPFNMVAVTLPIPLTAYLSDASGTFGSQVQVGNSVGLLNQDSILVTIPQNLILPGNYRLRLVSNTGSLISDTLSIGIIETPATPIITPNGGVVCDGSWVVLEGPVGPYNYLWSNNATSRQILVNSGVYSLRLKAGDCFSPVSSSVTVTASTTPVANFIQRNDSLLSTSVGTSYQWFMNNSPIAGANTPFYLPLQNGSYSVAISNAGCADTSVARFITSLDNQLTNYQLKMAPNPATSKVKLTGNITLWKNARTIRIVNLLGQEVRSDRPNPDQEGSQVIDLNGLAVGAYRLEILGTGVSKLLVIQ